MKALVTGGTGFIGSHLVEELLVRGFEVTCLVRDPLNLNWLNGPCCGKDIRFVRGDCRDPESLVGRLDGAEYVFHLAGVTKAARSREYYNANAEGADNIAKAAAQAGVRKFVHVSSQAAAGPSSAGVPRREEDPPMPVSDYGRSKLLGEQNVLGLKDAMDVAVVRPTAVYGPRDRDVYEFFRMVGRGFRTSFADERLISICHVEDLVDGIMRAALKNTRSGDVFFISGDRPYTWDEIGEAISEAVGRKATRVVLPLAALSAVAIASEAVSLITRRPALLNRQKVQEVRQRYWVADTARAKEQLGFSASINFADGARQTARWYRENGWL
ncbi:MAG TPA: NAD-dependent epimerase/dehydratase family protein [Nitrospirota bacterium]